MILLDKLLSYYFNFGWISFPLAFLGGIILIFTSVANLNNKPKKIYKIIGNTLILQLFIIFFSMLFLKQLFREMVSKELIRNIKLTSSTIKGKNINLQETQVKLLIQYISSKKEIKPHHSSPTRKTTLYFINQLDTSIISLYQDSEIKKEFHIYWDKYDHVKELELKRIHINDKDLLDVLAPFG
ncbi:hypothetical protein Fleli_0403 [Bernardetia litoralis DSM 6794]|uniref:Uncharacterized protein n=2 Tax=Bernardetia litoralis TaxID=999 RepID=I4AFZ4_BERLS|nr:hypothetical protein Fleli_0403 [Bernardetia litoralis DSM 6794]